MNANVARSVCLLLVCGVPVTAQVAVVPTHDQKALLSSKDPRLAQNKKLVYDFWRIVLEAGHVEAVDQFISEGYIQHNPNVATGKQGLVAYIKRWVKPTPIADVARSPLISITAEGDLVVVSEVLIVSAPKAPGGHYTTTSFDMFRIEGDKIVEHWDSESLDPPPS
ncbi:MAG: nuclear transport factor 2 family protein [Candidatus Eremiobacteraeota bacterium]|nr:nuclear transport factor 2 family protein [Candidatus Eremiobacteraeota bacterium]